MLSMNKLTQYNSEHPRFQAAVDLLRRLIAVPSPSGKEDDTAAIWQQWLEEHGVGEVCRVRNNVFVVAPGFDSSKPILMLNSHHDTVRPSTAYTRDPYSPDIADGRIYGLGSNDAGASGVALAATFLDLASDDTLPVNLLFAISASEENMSPEGMRLLLPELTSRGLKPDMAIVGEPTGMQPAVAERGLLVLDGVATGRQGHAARDEGINAIYRAIEDIGLLQSFSTPVVSSVLGPIKVSITMIEAGTQHNVVPATCSYVVDVRTTDAYTNQETVELLRQTVRWSSLTPRSTHIGASALPLGHPLFKAALALGLEPFVSPTTSDMALLHGIPSLKIGPGQSSRSHAADEYVCLDEINEALYVYPQIIKNLANGKTTLEQGF